MRTDKKKTNSTKSILQWVSVGIILLSSLPCVFVFINISAVIQYGIQTENNAALRLYIPLIIASFGVGIGLLLLISSLLFRKKLNQDE